MCSGGGMCSIEQKMRFSGNPFETSGPQGPADAVLNSLLRQAKAFSRANRHDHVVDLMASGKLWTQIRIPARGRDYIQLEVATAQRTRGPLDSFCRDQAFPSAFQNWRKLRSCSDHDRFILLDDARLFRCDRVESRPQKFLMVQSNAR